MSTKVFITGITSSIGVCAIEWVKENIPNAEIFGCGRNSAKLENISNTYNIETRVVDFNDDNNMQQNAEEFAKIDLSYILHLAADSPSSTEKNYEYYNSNFVGPRGFFDEIFRLHNPSFLNFSSASIYDPNWDHIDEGTPFNDYSDYGISKHLFEKYLNINKNLASLLSVRVPVLLAPAVRHNFISGWESQVQLEGKVTVYNPEFPFNSCVWLDDIFSFALYYFSSQKNNHLVCNVGALSPISIKECLGIFMNERGHTAEIISYDSPRPSQFYDSSLAMRYGYKPKTVKECVNIYAQSLQQRS